MHKCADRFLKLRTAAQVGHSVRRTLANLLYFRKTKSIARYCQKGRTSFTF